MAGVVNRQYTLDVNVQEGGAAEQSVNVRAWNAADTSVLDKTTDVNGDITSTILTAEEYSLTGNALSAAISEDNAVFTDETTDANNATANDVTLLPAAAAATDRFYVGYSSEFPQVEVNVGTAGAGTYTLAWTYWNGSTWSALTVDDGTGDFKRSGWNTIRFTEPGDWDTTTVNSQGPFYYIRCTRDAGTQTTQPLGTQLYVTTQTTTVRNPFNIRALKWLLQVLDLSVNLSAPAKQTLFMTSNSNITQTNQSTVQAYSGISFAHGSLLITLTGGAGTPVNDMDKLYDRCQDEAIVNEQAATPEILATVDGQNYTLNYGLRIDALTNPITLDGQGRSIGLGPLIELKDGGVITDITLNSNLWFTTGSGGTDLTSVNVTAPGEIEFQVTGTFDFTDCTISEVSNISGGAVTINALGTTTIALNSGPNITIISAKTIKIQGVTEGTSCVIQALETVGSTTAGDILLEDFADSNGEASAAFNYEGDIDIVARARNSGLATAAIQDDNGAYTDQTEEANSSTTNDMNLLPATPQLNNDSYLFGHTEQFEQLKIDIGTAGTGGFTITWEYWNGAWVALTGVTDGTNSFANSGENTVSWNLPGDWATTTINGQGPYYYVRARYTAGTVTIVPLGKKATLDVTRYLPFVQNNTIGSSGLTVTAVWLEDTIATF